MKPFICSIATASLWLSAITLNAQNGTFNFGTATNPEGHSVTVDKYGILMDGHHTIPVMGELHYSRVPVEEWRNEIRKMKAGGITILSTYCFWIHHEAEEGKWDWSGNKDLHRFLQTCKEEQMPVVLRVGPFCHGEVYQGGFPEWIVKKATEDAKLYKLRSTAPGFLAATQRLYSNIYAQASDMLWKHGGPIVGVQIENECRGPWSYYMALKDMAVSIGFDTPFYTRTGWPKLNGKEEFGKLLPLYGDYADGFWDRVLTDMPGDYKKAFIMKDSRLSTVIATETFSKDELTASASASSASEYPYLTCELGGGMMPAYHRRINISGNEAFPLAVCKVGSGSNLPGYYMYHGGTNPYNPEHTMAETQATSVTNYNDMPYITYDFQSPLGEMGQLNENAYHQTRWFHQFLADWGEELSTCTVDSLSDHYARRGAFVFRNDYVRLLNEQGSASVSLRNWHTDNFNTDGGICYTITTQGIQPFAKCGDTIYFINIKGEKKFGVNVNGKNYALKYDQPKNILGKTFVLLSPAKAKTAFVIDGEMRYAQHGGILYKGDNGKIVEECWQQSNDLTVSMQKQSNGNGLRTVKMGSQKVAAMPVDDDFANAASWTVSFDCDKLKQHIYDTFLQINYNGDVARIYADGTLVEDNFWNGKPMLVRLSDLVNKNADGTLSAKKIELRILPLGKDYPIYLQKEQKAELDKASDSGLLDIKSTNIIQKMVF